MSDNKKHAWHPASKKEPCPICGKTDWCLIADNGSAVGCRRVKSDKQMKGGAYYHRLKTIPYSELPPEWRRRKSPMSVSGVFRSDGFFALPSGVEQDRICAYLAKQLGVLPRALLSLDMRWDNTRKAAAFPMKAPNGSVTGVGYRYIRGGDKFNAEGSVDGLFLPLDLNLLSARLIVCEGASDTAAALSLGYSNVVGRSSCRTGETLVKELCLARRVSRVLIVADRDPPAEDGSDGVGMMGAKKLAETLADLSVKIIQPPEGIKDLRQWLNTDRQCARQGLGWG